MRENRETCSAPVNQTGRSAKAQSQTADVYALLRSTGEAAEQRGAALGGGGGGKAVAQGERRAIQHQTGRWLSLDQRRRNAVTVNSASSVRPSVQPITRRENASSTTARYTNSVRKRM